MFRDIVKGIAKNTSIMLVQQAITWASSLLLVLFLPRYLGPIEYGKLFLALSIYEIFRVLVNYGGNYLVAKHVSRDRSATPQILVDAAVLRFLIALVSVVGLVGFVLVADYSHDTQLTVYAVGVMLLWNGGITALYAAYQGHELLKYTSLGAIVERVVVSIVGVASLLMGAGKIIIALVITFGNFLNFLCLIFFIKRITPSLSHVNWQNVFRQLRSGLPYFLFAVFSTIYYRIDSLMLSKMSPEEVVGWYGGAFRPFDMLNFLPFILTVALYPVLSRLWSESGDAHKRTTQKGLEIVILAAIPLSIGVSLFTEDLIGVLYGLEGYANSVTILQVLTCGLIFLYVDMVLVTTLLACDKQKQFSFVSLGAIPFKIILNYFLIDYYQAAATNGGIGAAIATVLTEGCIMVMAITLMPKGILSGFRFRVLAKGIAAGASMFGVLLLMSHFGTFWVLQIPIGAAVYIASVFTLRTFEPAEIAFLKQVVSIRSFSEAKELLRPDSSTPGG